MYKIAQSPVQHLHGHWLLKAEIPKLMSSILTAAILEQRKDCHFDAITIWYNYIIIKFQSVFNVVNSFSLTF